MKKIIDGVKQFQSHVFSPRKDFYEQLSLGQRPEALFVTCSDSRIHPQLMTQTDPGDLFILRNAGNLIPSFGAASACGEVATIDFAVEGLGIQNLIVCGHSGCGAMKALLALDQLPHGSPMRGWLTHAESARRVVNNSFGHLEGEALLRAVIQENVLVQIEHLKTHPAVRAGLARGTLSIFGWMYELETGRMLQYDPNERQFTPLEQPKSVVDSDPRSRMLQAV